MGGRTGFAMVDVNGNPFTRMVNILDSGWVAGFVAVANVGGYCAPKDKCSAWWSLGAEGLTVMDDSGWTCNAQWPNT